MLQSRARGLVGEYAVARSQHWCTRGDVCAPAPRPNCWSCGLRSTWVLLWKQWDQERWGYEGLTRNLTSPRAPYMTVQEGAVSGSHAYLTKEEENDLAHFLLGCAQFGFPRTWQQVISIAQSVASQGHDDVEVYSGWWQSLWHRHPEIVLRNPKALSQAKYIPQSVIDQYYDLLEQIHRTMGWRVIQSYFLTVMKQVFLWITCQRRPSHQQLSSTCMPQHLEVRHTPLSWHVSVLQAKCCSQRCDWKGSICSTA